MKKITFDSYVPEDCFFIDEGWNKDAIYCKTDLNHNEIKNLLKWHKSQTEISKIKNIQKTTGNPKFLASVYDKDKILAYTDRQGNHRTVQLWKSIYINHF